MSKSDKKKSNCCLHLNSEEKLKILAIHGYRQSADVFRQKTGSFRKMVHKWAQFTFITAPHKVIPVESLTNIEDTDTGNSVEIDQYGWFFNRDDRTFRGIRKGGPAIGFEESLTMVERIFDEYGPFDGIFGFSQGACFVGLLCDLQQRGLLKFNFDFAIMSSGFKSGSLPHMKYYSENITLPVLNIYGETDDIIPKEMSEELGKVFINAHTVIHPGKHYLAASALQKPDYEKFFETQFLKKSKKLQEYTTSNTADTN